MNKPITVVKTSARMFQALLALMRHVVLNMTLNPNFSTPTPALTAVTTAADDLEAAIAAWGPVGNRGRHSDHAALEQKAAFAHGLTTQLADYCMTVINPATSFEDQTAILLTSGFPVKNAKTPQGVLGMVENFKRVIGPTISLLDVKLSWEKPLGSKKENIRDYLVFRNTTNNFATASFLASTGPATYTDSPGVGTWYYWALATNSAGNGVTSNVVSAVIAAS